MSYIPLASRKQRFAPDSFVSHNPGDEITADSKRRVIDILGYDPVGGMQYRLVDIGGYDKGLAFDGDLDPWPGDEAEFPVKSPRAPAEPVADDESSDQK